MPLLPNKLPLLPLTADTTLTFPGYGGAFITNSGATAAVVITLPASSTVLAGSYCWVYVTVNQDVTVATTTTDTLIVDGDVAADSIGWVTSSHKVGNGAMFVCIGAATAGSVGGWACMLSPGATTTTIATQTITTA
jgi:hypothetical protein